MTTRLFAQPGQRPTARWRYAAALGIVAAAWVLSYLLYGLVEPNPFIFFFAAVALSAWYGGLLAGLLAIMLSIMLVRLTFVATVPTESLALMDGLRFAIFGGVALLISWLSESRRAALQSAHEQRTKLEATVAELRSNESQLRLITDALPVLISYIDAQQHYQFTNHAYETWFGQPQGNIIGRHMRDVLGNDAYTVLQPHIQRALAGEYVAFDSRIPYRSGGTRYVHASYQPDLASDGRVRGFVALVEDISDRKWLEEGQELLVEAGAAFASTLDYEATLRKVGQLVIPRFADIAVIYLSDGADTITRIAANHVNPAKAALLDEFERRYPASTAEGTLLGQVLHKGKPLHANNVSAEDIEQLARDAEQLRLMHEFGAQAYIVVPIRGREHTLGAMAFVQAESRRSYSAHDLHLAEELAYRAGLAIENARLYNQALEARKAAEAAVQTRDAFLSVAAHELKTPLTSLLMQAQLVQRRLTQASNLADRDRHALKVIINQVRRLNRMIVALLDISRIEQGQLSIAVAPVQLGALVQQVVDELQPVTNSHTISFTALQPDVVVWGDELRLEQVVQNLLQNAIKYSPSGGTVLVWLEHDAQCAYLHVSDQGIGIPAAALPQLFTRFYRAPNADPREISGLGIGLYVVKEIVRLHGGSVTVTSQEGAGSTFTVSLPFTREGRS